MSTGRRLEYTVCLSRFRKHTDALHYSDNSCYSEFVRHNSEARVLFVSLDSGSTQMAQLRSYSTIVIMVASYSKFCEEH